MPIRIAVIDTGLTGWETLAAGLEPDVEVVLIDPEKDGVLQIAAALEGRSGIDAIHVVSHGSSGALYLGTSVLTTELLQHYATELTAIGAALAQDGDLLLYGCEVASGEAGRNFVAALAEATGAEVAASVDRTGTSWLGGNWELELATGQIEAGLIATPGLQHTYDGVLAPGLVLTGTAGNDTLIGGSDDDQVFGLDGTDSLEGGPGNDSLDGGGDSDSVYGGPGNDTLLGGLGGDFLEGGAGDDSVVGGDGDDYLVVYDYQLGNDTLNAGPGNDLLFVNVTAVPAEYVTHALGDDGDDRFVIWGNGSLVLQGGTGLDTYVLRDLWHNTYATVTDFAPGSGGDRIELLSGNDSILSQSVGYTGGNPFDPLLGYLRLTQSGADTLLEWDRDGIVGSVYAYGTLLVLQNLDKNTITVYNFAEGFSPDGSAAPGRVITGTSESDALVGGVSNDTISGLAGSDFLEGGPGDDLLDGGGDADVIYGGDGNDTLLGGPGNDYLWGEDGDDSVDGGEGDDVLDVSWPPGNNTLRGGVGNDSLSLHVSDYSSQDVTHAHGDDGEDRFEISGNGSVFLEGGAGQDTYRPLSFFSGTNATIADFAAGFGGDQIDLLSGHDPYEPVLSESAGYTAGNPFDPLLGYLRLTQSGADTLLEWDRDGAVGSSYAYGTLLVLQNLDKDTITSHNFVGDIPPDGSLVPGQVISGTPSPDTLVGGTSNDTLYGLDGSDHLEGGPGDDLLDGGSDWDFMYGGPGDDTVLGGLGNDYFWGDDGDDSWDGGEGDDDLRMIAGQIGNDTLHGGAGNDSFTLGPWAQYVTYAYGDDGDDSFDFSGNGFLFLQGGAGRDTYYPGSGSYGTGATVADFAVGLGGDQIDLLSGQWSILSQSAGYTGGNPFSPVLGYLRLTQSGADTLLEWDQDGAAVSGHAYATQLVLQNLNKDTVTSDNFVGRLIVGTPENDTLVGGLGNDTIEGLAGDDILDGSVGADSLEGGPGSDTYYVDSVADQVLESSNGPADFLAAVSDDALQGVTDTVVAAINYSLTNVANVENLRLTGEISATAEGILPTEGVGNELNNVVTGNELNNTLNGLAGDDTVLGVAGNDTMDGGTGADWMYGGVGDDTYTVDGQQDIVFEFSGEGTDTVVSSANFYLYAGIEKLVLASGAGDIFGSANELSNTLTGNEGVNLLLGWDGLDTLYGGAGNDILYGVNDPDVLYGEDGIDVLVGGGGNDTLDGGIEADLLAGEDGDDLLTGGTDFATDILIGGAGNDTLDGASANGDYDLMDGSAGDDTYRVDTPDDLTFEAEDGGRDAVIANISGAGYYLYPNVENITLIGQTPYGVGNDLNNVLTGSEQANWLLGGGGDDTINGKGGYDVLFGQDGADTFVFERGTGGDVIGDFTPGTDKLQLAGIGYTNVTEVKAHMVEAGGVSAIDLGAGDFVVLHNVTIASLSEGDLIFA